MVEAVAVACMLACSVLPVDAVIKGSWWGLCTILLIDCRPYLGDELRNFASKR